MGGPRVGGDGSISDQVVEGKRESTAEEGREACSSQRGQGHHKKTHRINKPGLIGAHRDRTNNQRACMEPN